MASEEDFDSRIPGGGSTYFYRRRDVKQADGSTQKFVWCLGAGGLAATFDCIKSEGGVRKPVAIKQVSLEKNAAEKLEAYEFRGLQSISGRDHPNIVKFITFLKGDDGDGRVRLSFVFERCPTVVPYLVPAVTNPKGFVVPSDALTQPERDGCDLVVNPLRKPPLTLREALHVTRQLLSAVAFLHSALPPIIHRDVKPDNTLIWGARPDPCTGEVLLDVKLTDYGTVRRADRRDLTLGQGTRAFMAPEVEVQTGGQGSASTSSATRDARPTAQYDASVDVFSVGATLFYLLSGQPPHGNTQLSWNVRFGGETDVDVSRMEKWAARRDKKRGVEKERLQAKAAAAAAAASTAAASGSGVNSLDTAGAQAEAPDAPGSKLPAIEKVSLEGDGGFVVIGGSGRAPLSAAEAEASTASRPSSAGPIPPTLPVPVQGTGAARGAGKTTILDFVVPPESQQRVFLEGMVAAAAAPPAGGASSAGTLPGHAPTRWSANEALAFLDATWPGIKADMLPGPGSVHK